MNIEILNTDEKITEICLAYWKTDESDEFVFIQTVSAIAKEYKLSSNDLLKLIQKNCVVRSNIILCRSCHKPYIFDSRKSYLASRSYTGQWECIECIQKARDRELSGRLELLNELLVQRLEKPVIVENLSARHSVLLYSLMRCLADEGLTYVNSLSSTSTSLLTPSAIFDAKVLNELYAHQLIAINPETDLLRIKVTDGKIEADIRELGWLIPSGDLTNLSLMDELEQKIFSDDFYDLYWEELYELSKEIALYECIAYLTYVLKEHGFRYDFGDKTFAVLKHGLERYSVAQMYLPIWSSAKNAASYYLRNKVSRSHAARTVVPSMEGYLSRAIVSDQVIKPFRRNFNLPQSVLGQIMFNDILQKEDGGFHFRIKDMFQERSEHISII